MTKQLSNPAQFLSDKASVKARSVAAEARVKAEPKSRKPSTKVQNKPVEATQPSVTSNLAAQLAVASAQNAVNVAPKAPKAAKTPDLKLVIVKDFKPRTNHVAEGDNGNFAQKANWDALVKAIQEHGGAITYAEAVAAVEAAGKDGGYEKTCNARGFVQGRVRNGHVRAA